LTGWQGVLHVADKVRTLMLLNQLNFRRKPTVDLQATRQMLHWYRCVGSGRRSHNGKPRCLTVPKHPQSQ
jgi:hypothetical protein